MLALGIRYLTGYAVATDVSSRERAEWPPHPARVFMALAASMFETGEDTDECDALEWLEQQGPPAMKASDAEPREVVTSYVPVNDNWFPKGKKALPFLQSVPLGRDRQPRTFPCVRPLEDVVYLVWPDSTPDVAQCAALESLCSKVTRVGHSSSLVQMWVESRLQEPNLHPSDFGGYQMRVAGTGTLGYLRSTFNQDTIEEYVDLQERIAKTTGTIKKRLKQELTERFGDNEPASLRPTISRWQAYQRLAVPADGGQVPSTVFDPQIMVLAIDDGAVIGLESTWALLTALRNTILSQCDPTPEWLTGHQADGSPSQQPHVALFPLAFVGREYADGHLLGVALAFPRGIEPRERGRALRGLLYDASGNPKSIELRLGSLGQWTLVREIRPSPPVTLLGRTWTGPADTWATVTPIVLDRQPKADRAKDRQRWSQEAAEIVADGCERQGLPQPVGIDIDKTSWFEGAPRAVGGNGAGFALMPVKSGQPSRQQVHAWLKFDQPIMGPLLLGAGRYRGYGLCRPWRWAR